MLIKVVSEKCYNGDTKRLASAVPTEQADPSSPWPALHR